MTKSTKHKKEFRKEKNKVQLKQQTQRTKQTIGKAKKTSKGKKKSAFLPKGLNVTDTSFKTRKIVLPENLRSEDADGVPSTCRKQTLKELMSHLNHHNVKVCRDGLDGARELLTAHPDLLDLHLGPLISKATELAVGIEPDLRKCALKLLDQVMRMAGTDRVAPHFRLLQAQLLCAMTHIRTDVQRDSYQLLDVLALHAPHLVAASSVDILAHFLEQISGRGLKTTSGSVAVVNPSQRLTSLKWRHQVLTRVHKLLELMRGHRRPAAAAKAVVTIDVTSVDACAPLRSTQRRLEYPLGYLTPTSSVSSSKSGLSSQSGSGTTEGGALRDLAAQLVPLVIETWVEALAGEDLADEDEGDGAGSLVSYDTAALLATVCHVLVLVVDLLDDESGAGSSLAWFDAQFAPQLMRHLVRRFPFSCRSPVNAPGKKAFKAVAGSESAAKTDTECREQNLMIAFLWARTSGAAAGRAWNKQASAVFRYMTRLFDMADREPLTVRQTEHFASMLGTTLQRPSLQRLVDTCCGACARLINRVRADRRDRQALCRVLLDAALRLPPDALDRLDRLPALHAWLERSPELLRSDPGLLPWINRAVCRVGGRVLDAARRQTQVVLGAHPQPNDQVHFFLEWTTVAQ